MLNEGFAADISPKLPPGYEAVFVPAGCYIEIAKKRRLFVPRRRVAIIFEGKGGLKYRFKGDIGEIDTSIRRIIKNH